MIRVILTTVGKKAEAIKLAKALVVKKLAGCVSVLPGVTSVYQWKKKLETSAEVQLIIKTSKVGAVEKFFKGNHPYELPEFVVLSAEASKKYERWLNG